MKMWGYFTKISWSQKGCADECSLEYSRAEHGESYLWYGQRASMLEHIQNVPQRLPMLLRHSKGGAV